MSIELNWEALTAGPDGDALAESIRDFIHTKFQAVPLPRFIKSVTVHEFAFGSTPPDVVLKDICDPLPDFYEENPDADEQDESDEDEGEGEDGPAHGYGENAGGRASTSNHHAPPPNRSGDDGVPDHIRAAERRRRAEVSRRLGLGSATFGPGSTPSTPGGMGGPQHIHTAGLRSAPGTPADLGSPFRGIGMPTPGISGAASNMHYFPSHIATGWSGTQTPLAAMAGAQHLNGWLDANSLASPTDRRSGARHGRGHGHARNNSQGSISIADFSNPALSPSLEPPPELREKHSVSTLAATSTVASGGASRPPTQVSGALSAGSSSAVFDDSDDGGDDGDDANAAAPGQRDHHYRERRVEDMQAVFRIKYAGDVKLLLTAEILLDYPMPSFVGIPVKLNITGLSFDGVGVVANIRKRVHFCFLSPEDALAAVGADDDAAGPSPESASANANAGPKPPRSGAGPAGRMGGLLQEIKVESEIGQREGTKQSLKNVGKVERFVLEQVRRIFEEEFVYPSFWTFLV